MVSVGFKIVGATERVKLHFRPHTEKPIKQKEGRKEGEREGIERRTPASVCAVQVLDKAQAVQVLRCLVVVYGIHNQIDDVQSQPAVVVLAHMFANI